MHYYERLKEIREDMDITQTEVAEAIGTTKQQIYAYEKGINKMSVERLKELCLYYGVSADYILGLPYENIPKKNKGIKRRP